MRKMINTLFFIFILFSFTISAYAQSANNNTGGYSVILKTSPIPSANTSALLNINKASMSFVSLYQLPLWIQLSTIPIIILGIFSLIKFLPLYTGRLKHVLDNPKTKEIFYFIQRNPGVTIAEISDEQKINRGTLKYHLSQLVANNKIIFVRKGKFSRIFFNTSSTQDKETLISRYLKNDKSKDILFAIMDTPGITNQELSSKFDLAKSSIHDYLKNLSDDNIVEFHQDGKFKRCYIQQDARMILLRYKPL